jgi:tetratricopeptide (TPR) repeat protein
VRKCILLVVILFALLFVFTPPAHAQAGAWVDRGLDVTDVLKSACEFATTGNPWRALDVLLNTVKGIRREMTRQEMAELKKTVRALQIACDEIPALRAEMADIRNALDGKASRKEVEDLLRGLRADMEQEFRRLNIKMDKLEGDVEDLKKHAERTDGDVVGLKNRAERTDGDVAGLKEHAQRTAGDVAGLKHRADVHEQWILDHERRIQELERKVASLGVNGFTHYRQKEFDKAVEKFNEAIENDPGDPSCHYGKALALNGLGRTKEAEKEVKTGIAAERLRASGPWYATAMERVQGPDRSWLAETRKEYLPVRP